MEGRSAARKFIISREAIKSSCVAALLRCKGAGEPSLGGIGGGNSCWCDLDLGLSLLSLLNSLMSGSEFVDNWLNELKDCVLLHFGGDDKSAWLQVEVAPVDLDSIDGRLLCKNSGLDSADGKNLSHFSIKISITSLQNLMSMIEATVSSLGLKSVGPKQTPKLDAVIKFLSCLIDTLFR